MSTIMLDSISKASDDGADEWKVLWIATKKSKPPKEPPNIKWAYKSLGKLGG